MPPGMYPSPNERPKYDQQKPRLIVPPIVVIATLVGASLCAGHLLSTGILAVNYATPSRDVARVAGATLGGKVSLAGISRSNGRSPGVAFQTLLPAAPSRAHGLAQPSAFKSLLSPAPSRSHGLAQPSAIKTIPNAAPSRSHGQAFGDLSAGVVNFNMGNGLSRASGLAPGATVKSLIPAALSRSHGLAQPGTLKILLSSAPSRSHGLAQPAALKSLIPSALSRSNGIGAAAFLGGKVSLASLSRSNGLGTAQLSTHFPTTDIGGAIARDTASSRATGIVLVGYASPSREIGLAGPATLRFQGAGFDMGSGLSRAEGRALGPSLLKRVYYATPMRGAPRTFAAIQLHQETGPSRATGLARCLTTLGLQGQQPPTISRGMGGRALSVHIKLYYGALSPSGASGRAVGLLQFGGGPKTNIAGLSRASSKAHGLQLQTLSGPKIGVAGLSRSEGRARSASTPTLLTLYYVTPSKADPRASAWLHTHQETGPSRGMGGRSLATLTSSLHINLQGLSRQSARVRGAVLTIRPQLVGVSLAESRALGTVGFNKLPVSAAPSREIGLVHCAPLAFAPPNFVTIQGGISRASSRAVATIKTTNAAQASIGSARTPGATLTSKQALTSTSRAAGLANAQLGFTGALVIALDGDSYATSRTFADLHISLAGGWIQGHGRAVGEPPSYRLALRGSSLGHPRAVAVLAFTGASVQPVAGTIRAHAQAVGFLKIVTLAAPSMAHGLSITNIELLVRLPLTGTSRAQALATGAFENPFASPISRAHGYTASGLLVSSLPLDAGASVGTGRVYAELTIPKELPELIFLAKSRVFVFKARGRVFVIAARDRRFIFPAGGHREQIC